MGLAQKGQQTLPLDTTGILDLEQGQFQRPFVGV